MFYFFHFYCTMKMYFHIFPHSFNNLLCYLIFCFVTTLISRSTSIEHCCFVWIKKTAKYNHFVTTFEWMMLMVKLFFSVARVYMVYMSPYEYPFWCFHIIYRWFHFHFNIPFQCIPFIYIYGCVWIILNCSFSCQ